jgi:putative Holliday junction resolvase
MVDERLSSFEAKGRAREEGHKGDYKVAPVDALAARILVEQWLGGLSS